MPGTVIHSDDYATYRCIHADTYTWSTYAIHFTPNYRTAVGQLPNVAQHRIVNHSLHFVDLMTNVHTQHVESYWNCVKIKFKRMRGVDLNQLPSYLDEFMWFE